jgi:hypothetical protein
MPTIHLKETTTATPEQCDRVSDPQLKILATLLKRLLDDRVMRLSWSRWWAGHDAAFRAAGRFKARSGNGILRAGFEDSDRRRARSRATAGADVISSSLPAWV